MNPNSGIVNFELLSSQCTFPPQTPISVRQINGNITPIKMSHLTRISCEMTMALWGC